jgi:twitching motility protein PilJ
LNAQYKAFQNKNNKNDNFMLEPPIFPKPKKKSRSIWLPLSLLIVFVVLMIVTFGYSYTHSAGDKEKIALASDLSLLSQQLVTSVISSTRSGSSSFDRLQELKDRFEVKFQKLQEVEENGAKLGMAVDNLDHVRISWKPFAKQVNFVLESRQAITRARQYAETVYETLPALQLSAEQVVLRLEEEKGHTSQLNTSISQLILLQKLQNSLLMMLEGKSDVESVTREFANNIVLFGDKLDILMDGDSRKKIPPVSNPQAKYFILEISSKFNGLGEKIGALLDYATVLQQVHLATRNSELLGKDLFDATRNVEVQITDRGSYLQNISMGGYLAAVLAIVSLLWLISSLYAEGKERLRVTEKENAQNQEAIMNLLDEMTALSEGDLTVSAKVTEDITGAIADAFNYTVEALRSLVTRINNTSTHLIEYADKANQTAGLLSLASKEQSDEVVAASSTIITISESVDRVSKYTANSATVAQNSLEISRQGVNTVRETISGMHSIREQVQATAKRIKRLSESSQEVSHISQLMNDIAEQTQLLALNASIQMSSAGDAGKGFGHVAEEVQQLAKRALATSRKVDVLVKTMQEDTKETVASMEDTISHVVVGTASAEKAGNALGEVESESARLAKLMSNIAKATGEQSVLAGQASDKMVAIQDITLQAFERVNETTELINNLTQTANEMQESIYRFTLAEMQAERDDEVPAEEENNPKLDLHPYKDEYESSMDVAVQNTQEKNKELKQTVEA